MELREKIAYLCECAANAELSPERAAERILAIPEIAEALDWWEMNLAEQRKDA